MLILYTTIITRDLVLHMNHNHCMQGHVHHESDLEKCSLATLDQQRISTQSTRRLSTDVAITNWIFHNAVTVTNA